MEYVPSKSLADLYHEQNGPMDPIKLLPILIQTARGLFRRAFPWRDPP